MTTWKQRLRAEFYELDARHGKLTQFIREPRPELEPEDLLLLQRQAHIMGELYAVLFERLKRAGWMLSLRPRWMTGSHHCDWTEDFEHENGNYHRKCMNCESDFVGHKRRILCRDCHTCEEIKNAD